MPKKTYKRKHRSMSKRSRGMKRYKKTKRTRTRGGDNDNLYSDNNYSNTKPIINYDKDYGLMYNKPNSITNNDKFKYYPPINVNNKIINTSYKDDLYENPIRK
jgi:hypothetical protein